MSAEKAAKAGLAAVDNSVLSAVSSDCTRLGSTMPLSQGARHCAPTGISAHGVPRVCVRVLGKIN